MNHEFTLSELEIVLFSQRDAKSYSCRCTFTTSTVIFRIIVQTILLYREEIETRLRFRRMMYVSDMLSPIILI